MGNKIREQELEQQTKILNETIKKLFKERGEIEFAKEPVLVKRTIIEYHGRMRADGMEKFNHPTYVAFVNYYVDAKSMEKHNALGALVVYVEQGYIVPLMKKLKYPPIDDEDENAMKDGCGALCNIIAGAYKSAMVTGGYAELEMSHFSTYRNTAANGVEFCFKEWDKYEISYYLDGEKRLVVELTMGAVPQRR